VGGEAASDFAMMLNMAYMLIASVSLAATILFIGSKIGWRLF
jgi:hypothetical protein